MKNKKGFTLVELMAVIVVLALVIAIAIPAYDKIQKGIIDKNYENMISLLETTAAKYAEETNVMTMYVDTLIKKGYLDADDEQGNLFNPKNNERLNCNIIQVEKNNNQYYPKFLNVNYENPDKTCDTAKLADFNKYIQIVAKEYETNKDITKDSNYWTKKDVVLTINKIEENLVIKNIDWYEGNNLKESGMNYSYTIHTNSNTSFFETIIAKITGQIDGEEIIIQSSYDVKIDKIIPYFGNNLNITPDIEKWTVEKSLNFDPYDNESGFMEYATVALNGNCNDATNWRKSTFKKYDNNIKEKICIKDFAGNLNEKEIEIKNIDNTTPNCNNVFSVTGSKKRPETQWYTSDVTIKAEATAGPSGLYIGIDTDKPYYKVEASKTGKLTKMIQENSAISSHYAILKTGAGRTVTCSNGGSFGVEKSISSPIKQSVRLDADFSSNGYAVLDATDGYAISGIAQIYCSSEYTTLWPYIANESFFSNGLCYAKIRFDDSENNNLNSLKKCVVSSAGNEACVSGSVSYSWTYEAVEVPSCLSWQTTDKSCESFKCKTREKCSSAPVKSCD